MGAAWVVASTASGAALVLFALLDVFVTLFFHTERHALSLVLIRATWSGCRAFPSSGVLSLAGPVSYLIVVASWVVMLSLGWALVYWPWMPGGFALAASPGGAAPVPVPGDAGRALLDSLYFSLVTLATLGYGDFSPSQGWLRMVAPLESLLGLGLLTASVSWLLSIFPVLSRRRALAYEIRLLEEVRSDPTDPGPPEPLPAGVYSELTSRLVAGERDLVTFPVTYYFREDDPRFALPAVLGHLLELAEDARRERETSEVHFHGGLLLRAIDDFAAGIAERFRLPGDGTTRGVLRAYADDHKVRAG